MASDTDYEFFSPADALAMAVLHEQLNKGHVTLSRFDSRLHTMTALACQSCRECWRIKRSE